MSSYGIGIGSALLVASILVGGWILPAFATVVLLISFLLMFVEKNGWQKVIEYIKGNISLVLKLGAVFIIGVLLPLLMRYSEELSTSGLATTGSFLLIIGLMVFELCRLIEDLLIRKIANNAVRNVFLCLIYVGFPALVALVSQSDPSIPLTGKIILVLALLVLILVGSLFKIILRKFANKGQEGTDSLRTESVESENLLKIKGIDTPIIIQKMTFQIFILRNINRVLNAFWLILIVSLGGAAYLFFSVGEDDLEGALGFAIILFAFGSIIVPILIALSVTFVSFFAILVFFYKYTIFTLWQKISLFLVSAICSLLLYTLVFTLLMSWSSIADLYLSNVK